MQHFSQHKENSQAAVAALAASGTKLLLIADCVEKLSVLSEVNRVIIMWIRGHGGIQQNETADRLARERARARPVGPQPFLPLSLNRFKSKIRNWIEKREQTEWKVCEKYGTRQSHLVGSTDSYVQFISKLDRKHCRMSVGPLTRHINLQYMLHKMRRVDFLMQEMRYRKGNIGTYSMWMPCVGEYKNTDLVLCQDGSGTSKRG